jgi:hypothetical protein
MGTGEVRSDGGELGEFLSAASDWHVGDVLHRRAALLPN